MANNQQTKPKDPVNTQEEITAKELPNQPNRKQTTILQILFLAPHC